MIYGKDKLTEKHYNQVDITKRQTPEVLAFKQQKQYQHNK
jgi:hypothetical protein